MKEELEHDPIEEPYMDYEEALKTIQDQNCKPIRLEIGKLKKFEGVEVENIVDHFGYCDCGCCDCNGCYDAWLFIKCDPKYIDYFDQEFTGENFRIYGETCGTNFKVMGKSNTKRIYKNPKTKIVYL